MFVYVLDSKEHVIDERQAILYYVSSAIWSIFFSPLSHIPGPWYASVTRAFYVRQTFKGTTVTWLKELHDKYGDAVRYSPNEISFISGETAWQDIYGFRTGRSKNTGTFLKDPAFYSPAKHMLVAGDGDHGRQRRIISHGFSDKALREQEGLIIGYVDLLVNRLKEVISAAPSKSVDLTQWYDWTTFDIIADLVYGSPFGCLQELKAHHHVELILASIKAVHLYYAMHYWPVLKHLANTLWRKRLAARAEFRAWCHTNGQKRIETETKRPDFITAILENNEKKSADAGVSDLEIKEHTILFLVAGTETTATTMAAVTSILLKNPEALEKLKKEVRGRFQSNEEINIEAVGQLEYMLAVLNESLRIMPPVPAGFARKVPAGGATISGTYVPGNVDVSRMVLLWNQALWLTKPQYAGFGSSIPVPRKPL